MIRDNLCRNFWILRQLKTVALSVISCNFNLISMWFSIEFSAYGCFKVSSRWIVKDIGLLFVFWRHLKLLFYYLFSVVRGLAILTRNVFFFFQSNNTFFLLLSKKKGKKWGEMRWEYHNRQCSKKEFRKKGKSSFKPWKTSVWLESILSLVSALVRDGCASSKNVVTAARSMALRQTNAKSTPKLTQCFKRKFETYSSKDQTN